MNIKLFTIPIAEDGAMLREMNRFLSSHKVLEISKSFYQSNDAAAWCFCVKYIVSTAYTNSISKKGKIDYKEVLNEVHFKKFSLLREIRKQIATKDAVPAYAVFTDAELAEICTSNIEDAKAMKTINGIGEKKVEKYGEEMMKMYNVKNRLNEKS